MSLKKFFPHLLIAIIFIFAIIYLNNHLNSNPGQSLGTTTSATLTLIPSPSINSNCQVKGPLPDPKCTPGATFPDIGVDQICVPGYSSQVRNVPDTEKKAVYEAYGIITHSKGQYEIDHFISLELGGSNDQSNLWPESATPVPGFHQKDKLENYLHQQVCAGKLSLSEAQRQIATDWLAVYDSLHL